MKLATHPSGLAVIEPERCVQVWTREELEKAGYVPKERAEKAEADVAEYLRCAHACDEADAEISRLQSERDSAFRRVAEAQREACALNLRERIGLRDDGAAVSTVRETPLVTAEATERKPWVWRTGLLGINHRERMEWAKANWDEWLSDELARWDAEPVEQGVLPRRSAVDDLAQLLKDCGARPYFHKPGCEMKADENNRMLCDCGKPPQPAPEGEERPMDLAGIAEVLANISDEDDPTCAGCGEPFCVRDGCEVGPFCDDCAHAFIRDTAPRLVSSLQSTQRDLLEANRARGIAEGELRETTRQLEEAKKRCKELSDDRDIARGNWQAEMRRHKATQDELASLRKLEHPEKAWGRGYRKAFSTLVEHVPPYDPPQEAQPEQARG